MTVSYGSPPEPKRRLGTLLGAHAVLTLLLGAAYLGGAYHYEDMLVTEARAAAMATAATHAGALSSGLNERLALVRGLAAFVTVHAADDDLGGEFADFAEALGRPLTGVRNISAAPDFIVRYVNPLKGNERVLGNDLLKDPRPGFAETVQRALITRDVTVHGPLPLLQGGQGIIARQVVFGPARPWGAVGMVFDLQPILDTGRFDTLPDTLTYALRDGEGRVVTGDPAVMERNPVMEPVPIPGGQWHLALAPPQGWGAQAHQGNAFALFNTAFALVALLAQTVLYLMLSRRMMLEGLVARRTAELTRTQKELERFASVAAHDLREPLRTLTGAAQLLARTLDGRLDAGSRDCIAQVLDGAGRLKVLLRDIQFFLAEDRIPLTTGPTPVDAALAGALAALKGRIDATGATVTAGTLGTVMADPRRLQEILAALIANAIDFRTPGCPPAVYVDTRTGDGMDIISVTDNGIGIERQYLEAIFDVFRRLDGREGRPGAGAEHTGGNGTGMGLAIARKMTERLGGRITVVSGPGKGSTFSIHLPRRPTAEAAMGDTL